MKVLGMIALIIVLILATLVVSVVMAILIRVQEHDQQIQDIQRDIANIQQGGQEITARMNYYERGLQN